MCLFQVVGNNGDRFSRGSSHKIFQIFIMCFSETKGQAPAQHTVVMASGPIGGQVAVSNGNLLHTLIAYYRTIGPLVLLTDLKLYVLHNAVFLII